MYLWLAIGLKFEMSDVLHMAIRTVQWNEILPSLQDLLLTTDLDAYRWCSMPSTSKGYSNSPFSDVIMGAMASQITSLTIVHSMVYSYSDQRKHQSSALLSFVRGIHRWPVNSPHKRPVTRKVFPFDDVIMSLPMVRRLTKGWEWPSMIRSNNQ